MTELISREVFLPQLAKERAAMASLLMSNALSGAVRRGRGGGGVVSGLAEETIAKLGWKIAQLDMCTEEIERQPYDAVDPAHRSRWSDKNAAAWWVTQNREVRLSPSIQLWCAATVVGRDPPPVVASTIEKANRWLATDPLLYREALDVLGLP